MAVQNQRFQSSTTSNTKPGTTTTTTVQYQPTTTTTGTTSLPSATTTPKTTLTTKSKAFSMPQTNTNSMMNPTTTTATANGGPRVSFNRDVHVKRIGKHPDDITNYETTNLQPPQNTSYHQLPADSLSAEDIRREAALVLAQAERHKSKAENADNIPTFRVKTKRTHNSSSGDSKKFHSLPTRSKKRATGKPVARSVSDAAATKKPNSKRPSIFNIFSRKSDTNINQIERDPRFEDSGGRRLVRSKSDVGSNERKQNLKKSTKEQQATTSGTKHSQQPTPLSPIIEQKEDLFAEQFNRERRKSDAITEREKHDSGVDELLARSRLQAEVDGTLLAKTNNNIGVSRGIQDKIRTLQTKSNENMHSSQLPAQKLPLTKGVTVDGMVKRLSMERFSPPPTINSPAFSYIRPNEGITYAQLDMSDDSQQHQHTTTLPRSERIRSPIREPYREHARTPLREFRSPLRDGKTPEREFGRSATLQRSSVDRHDNLTSQNNLKNAYNNTGRTLPRDSHIGPTTIRISSSHSPSPWQQLSPRNLSDEDEGLGFETRKYFDETRSKSPAEPPIVPVIRSITPPPRENGFHHARPYRSPTRDDPVDGLGYRRAQLESRILTRRFGDATNTLSRNESSPERNRDVQFKSSNSHLRYLSPEREHTPFEQRFHKPQSSEILNKYSPERSHLDIIAPTATTTITTVNTMPKMEKTSRYRHTKYYNDGRGDGKVKEVYERETQVDAEGKAHVRESRYREPLDSSIERQQLTDYEPKSLDSQFTSTDQYRSSPENMKHQQPKDESSWHTSSLKRNKLQQRSFDKGDSGIENDFRKESFNGGDLSNRWRRRTPLEEMKACETFLKKERRHTEQQYVTPRRKDDYIYRERSIDDGSHFDPHLDKYPVTTSSRLTTMQRRDHQTQTGQGQNDTLKRNKKLGGFEKVKQLFTGGGGSGGGGGSSSHSAKKDQIRANSTTSSSTQAAAMANVNGKGITGNGTDKAKDKYMVREEEMRTRYREHRGNSLQQEMKPVDIATRRRLSTPKASPLLLKRTSSDKTPKKESPLAKPEKTSWFKSLDRRSKSKSKEKLNTPETSSTLKRSKASAARNSSVPPQHKNLRFFGDTDLDSNPPTISRAHTTLKARQPLSSTLNRSQKYSQSAYNLDRMNGNGNVGQPSEDYRRTLSTQQNGHHSSRQKSSSLHNLERGEHDEVDFRKRRHFSRSRDLHDISESGSETEEQHKRPNGLPNGRTLSRERLDRTQRYDENTYRRSNERQSTPIMNGNGNGDGGGGERNTNSMQRRAHLTGPPKPARSAERRILSSLSRERERFPGESSGTEGESSLHSQRSIVYLHATTVGAIPQPYHLRRRTMSRDDLRSNKSKNSTQAPPLQPMTRTVSRSVSLLAPWKPKHISDGYEINYSQEQNKRMSTLPHKSSHMNGGSTSTLTRTGNKKSETLRRMKDDQSSLRNSSTTSKSLLSSNLRSNGDTKRKFK